eukprot:718017-Rhodomonas_salina.1
MSQPLASLWCTPCAAATALRCAALTAQMLLQARQARTARSILGPASYASSALGLAHLTLTHHIPPQLPARSRRDLRCETSSLGTRWGGRSQSRGRISQREGPN